MIFILLFVTINVIVSQVSNTQKSNVVKLGVILPLTKEGVSLPGGDQKLLAFMMAINDAKASYAKQNITVRYTIRDSQGHYGLAGNAAAELSYNAKFPGPGLQAVHVVVGSDDNSITAAIGNAVTDYNGVAIAWGADFSSFRYHTTKLTQYHLINKHDTF